MGPGHALTGALVPLTADVVWTRLAGHPVADPAHLALFTVVSAGAALLPDIDVQGAVIRGRGSAMVGRSFGRASMLVAELTEPACHRVYEATRTEADPDKESGHRTLTHTWLACAVAGLVTATLAAVPGRTGWIATLVVLFLTTGLAVRGIMHTWAARHGWVAGALLAGVGTALAAVTVVPRGWPLIGLAVGVGCVTHTLGDMLTRSGCPVLWPLVIRGRRWYPAGTPEPIRFRAGGPVERVLVLPLATVATVVAAFCALPGVDAAASIVWHRVAGP
jgi:membrane-bound metal-dependent hydrolase YbcI (DUF457 family)